MKSIVLISGIWNLLLGLGLIFQALLADHTIVENYFNLMIGAFLVFTASVLVIASRNLQKNATFVLWEAFLRFSAAAILLTIGQKVIGNNAIFIGLTDILWGISYIIGLPMALKKSYVTILFDQ